METVLSLTETITRHLWSVSWQATVLVAIIWLVDRLSFRASPLFRYWLWMIVLIRLCIPVSVIPIHIQRIAHDNLAMVNLNFGDYVVETQLLTQRVSTYPSLAQAWWILGIVWFLIISVLGILILIHIYRIRQTLAKCTPVTKRSLYSLIKRLSQKMKIQQPIELYASDDTIIGAPAVAGVIRPRIILPHTMIHEWDSKELEPILLHELAHIKHRDIFINWLQIIIQIVYFFHPLVWLSNREIRKYREEFCDDRAVSHLSTNKMNYIKSILRVIEETVSKPASVIVRVGFIQTKHTIKERIKRIMNKNYVYCKPVTVRSIAVLLLIICLSVTLSFAEKSDIILEKNGVVLSKKGESAQDLSLSQNFPNPVNISTAFPFSIPHKCAEKSDIILEKNSVVLSKKGESAQDLSLSQNFPNPVNTSTTFPFSIPHKCTVSLKVYDKEGNEVVNLIEKEFDAGEYQIEWKNIAVSSGVYFYRLKAGERKIVKKMAVIM